MVYADRQLSSCGDISVRDDIVSLSNVARHEETIRYN